MSASRARQRIEENPFYILEVAPECSRLEAERQGQKLMAMLELKIESAAMYQTPLGPRARTEERVRVALAELRDPKKRLVHELWYLGDTSVEPMVDGAREEEPPSGGWTGALSAHGWRKE